MSIDLGQMYHNKQSNKTNKYYSHAISIYKNQKLQIESLRASRKQLDLLNQKNEILSNYDDYGTTIPNTAMLSPNNFSVLSLDTPYNRKNKNS